MIRLFGAKGFSKMYSASSQSKTYSTFCERVYGRDLCQANMLDEEQLQQLLSSLNLNPTHSVLDLGCGIGKITEYIHEKTGAKIHGVDFAFGAVEAANDRTKNNSNVRFTIGNLDKLEEIIQEKYDAIIMIDTLYFVSDLNMTIASLKKLLKPDGKLGLFYSSKKKSTDTDIDLLPENKPLGKALTESGFSFTTVNFTSNEKRIWEESILIANELKEDFIKEKNLEIYKGRIAEASKNVKWQEEGLMTRYFYTATLEKRQEVRNFPT